MAYKRMTRRSLVLALASLILLAGCGIKSMPIESSKLVPDAIGSLGATPVANGVLVSLNIPSADSPSQRIDEVILMRGYLPIDGDPECPPCPPRLRKKNVFNLSKQLANMESGRFTWLDEEAPMGMQAIYQVVIVDAAGRESTPSGYARAYRLAPPKPPATLTALMGENQVSLRWAPVTELQDGKPMPDKPAYLVFRRGPDGMRQLGERPQSATDLTDKTVITGQSYAYRVAAVRAIGAATVNGEPGPWVTASQRQGQPVAPPSGLMGASQADGVYLRFTPSPDRDASGYFVEKAATAKGPFTRLNAKPILDNTFVDADKKPGSRFYRVVALGEDGSESQPSPVLEFRYQP